MNRRLEIELGAALLLDFTYKRGEEVRVAKNVHASFVGVEHGEYLAVRLTVDPIEKYHYFFANLASIVVKYILKGTAYAFEVRLISKTDKPMPILFLSYPDQVETKSLRRDQRARCNPLAKISVKGGEYRGQIYDINPVGCRFDLLDSYSEQLRHLAKDERVGFSFTLPGIAETSEAEAVIKWSRPIGDAWSVGLVFTALEDDGQARIEAFMESVKRG